MATSSIPLAKGMNLSKMEWPAFLSVKKDGVPVKIVITVSHDSVSMEYVSRQGKHLGGVSANIAEFYVSTAIYLEQGVHTFIFETTHETLVNFKDVSGLTRKAEPQEGFLFNLFDYHWSGNKEAPFEDRIKLGAKIVRAHAPVEFSVLNQMTVTDEADALGLIAHMQETMPDVEGFILRAGNATFKPNSRHWDYQKVVVDPMHDLEVVGFEEAISKDGEPLGMVGRVNVIYRGEVTGCGPGKLTHDERIALWQDRGTFLKVKTNIATIKAKRDPSYAMLRQPTFQHWRYDKDEPNECE